MDSANNWYDMQSVFLEDIFFCYVSDELWDSNELNLGLSYICYNIGEKFNLMRELA